MTSAPGPGEGEDFDIAHGRTLKEEASSPGKKGKQVTSPEEPAGAEGAPSKSRPQRGKSPKVVLVRDYPKRNLVAPLFAIPLFFLVSTVVLMPVLLLPGVTGSSLFLAGLLATVVGELVVLAWMVSYGGHRASWREFLGLKNPGGKALLGAATLGILLFVLLQVLSTLLGALGVENSSSDTSVQLNNLTGIARVLGLYLAVPFVIPLVEELFFRGAIFGSFMASNIPEGRRLWVGTIFTSIFFALAHYQGFETGTDRFLMGWIFFTSLVFIWLRQRTGSIWASYAAHAGYNSVTALATIFVALT